METFTLICVLLVALVVLFAFYLCIDLPLRMDDCDAKLPVRTYRILTGCSFIIKFGMVLTAAALCGVLVPVGLTAAMAFAIPQPTRVPKGSWFDHSHNVATTLPFGAIVPIDWRFLQAGEKVQQNVSGFCRALQLKAPAMQDIDLKWATFFVPARLLCDKTEEIVSRPATPTPLSQSNEELFVNPVDIISKPTQTYSFPYFWFNKTIRDTIITACASARDEASVRAVWAGSFLTGGLMDYLGFPTASYTTLHSATVADTVGFSAAVPINLLPIKAYHSICNHFFVDDCFRRESAADSTSSGIVDILSSQSGLVGIATVQRLLGLRFSQYESDPFTKASTASRITRIGVASAYGTGDISVTEGDATIVNANTIRGLFALDEFARKVEYFFCDMRKQIKYMFGIITSDRSAMSPILVNAGTQPVQVSELNNTTLQAVDAEATRQSAGKMLSSFGQSSKTFVAEELGVYMTLAWIRPRTCYMNRLPHQFESWLDGNSIPNPLFSEIGDCVLKTRSVHFTPFAPAKTGSVTNTDYSDADFGYNTRYVLEKYTLDSYTGDFRDNLAYWHCAREFSSASNESSVSAGPYFRWINPIYSQDSEKQSLNRIFSVIDSVDGARPFQLQMRFHTNMWQLYPHIDDEM